MADSDHKHGSMNVEDQEKTFAGFITFVVYGVAITIAILLFIALVNG